MKNYLVGGAIRDRLLGLSVRERDFVVIGSTPEEMTALGFTPVGKDFPVFLHPKTHEEYALARTEKKISRGHQGFQFYTDPSITLEEDLKRRDLTVNAIAEDEAGNLIDPLQGQLDLERRVLRHVSDAFAEDPLRILRVARFYAYLGKFNFQIDPSTLTLMREMVREGALNELSDARVWQEILRALNTDYPHKFFEALLEIEASSHLFENLSLIPETLPRIKHDKRALIRFALLSYQARYLRPCPKEFSELAHLVRTYADQVTQFDTLPASDQVKLLRSLDYLRRPERLSQFLQATQALFPNWKADSVTQATTRLSQLDRASVCKDCKPNEISEKIFQAECMTLN